MKKPVTDKRSEESLQQGEETLPSTKSKRKRKPQSELQQQQQQQPQPSAQSPTIDQGRECL